MICSSKFLIYESAINAHHLVFEGTYKLVEVANVKLVLSLFYHRLHPQSERPSPP